MEQSAGRAFAGAGGEVDVIGAGSGVGACVFPGDVDVPSSFEKSPLNTKRSPAGESDPREVWLCAHEQLVKLARKRAGLDFEEGRWLLCAFRGDAHARLGFGSFLEYVERLFGYSPRLTREKLRVAEALEALPKTAEELRGGKISFSAVRELTRVATAETEGEWLNAAREKTVREVEELVSGQRPGALPGDMPDSGARRHVLRFDVSAEVLATFREAMTKIRRDAGEALDDDAALLLLARHVLGAARDGARDGASRDEAARDEGRSNYQIAMTVCEICRRGYQQAGAASLEVPPEVVAMACCDAQHIGRLGGAAGVPQEAAAQMRTESHVGADARIGVGEDFEQDVYVASDARGRTKAPRAKQSIPPAIRRMVLRRDRGRCGVPGCRHTTYVDVHHLDPRSEGGAHDPENLLTLCSAHHRGIHRGELVVEGRPAAGLRFSHADGTPYGGSLSPGVVATRAKACQALQGLGFREREAIRALAAVPADPSLSLGQIIVLALRAVPSPRTAPRFRESLVQRR